MREWNIRSGDPVTLTLAADARLGPTDYTDDQIWELSLGGGEPPALALQTTFGLRARILRIFPRFTNEADFTITDPSTFHQAPVITHLYPNFLTVFFAPFPNIDVVVEFWVPQSQAVACRYQIKNTGNSPRQIKVELVGQLTPTDGQRMISAEMQATPILIGQTGNLAPIIFQTGGTSASTGSYPALSQSINLEPGQLHTFTWNEAARTLPEESLRLARSIASRRWDAERARIVLLNAGNIDIYTGNLEWDIAFAQTQKIAYGLFCGPSSNFSFPSFVFSRNIDQGFSLRGDGSDYNHQWNGQTVLESLYLAGMILPAAPELAKGLVRNFISSQNADGAIDWKPGLGGQRSRLQAPPILASLAWQIYEHTEDCDFLQEVYPALLRFVHSWFAPNRDRDADGIPEWDHAAQLNADDHPIYSRWYDWSLGIDISTSETVGLSSFLFRECKLLIRMAHLLNRPEGIASLDSFTGLLRTAVETSWDPDDFSYYDWDRDTHYSSRGELLDSRVGPGEVLVQRQFEHAVRVHMKLITSGETTRRPQIFIHGTSASGHHRVEHVSDDRIRWYLGRGNMTGDMVYSYLERIEITGVDPEDRIYFYTASYPFRDLSVLLPLWAGIPGIERARSLVENTLTNPGLYWQSYGLPAYPQANTSDNDGTCENVNLPMNALVGEGMLSYGYREQAAELVDKLMQAILQSLKRDSAFRRSYQAAKGTGLGERNALQGLAPLGLFLNVLGVRLISPQRVALNGFNPFPWPVTVKYRGMTVLRQKEKTMVIFPDGQTVVVDDPAPKVVSVNSGFS